MKRLALIACVVLSTMLVPVLLTAPGRALDVAPISPGVEIPVRLTERLSSQDARTGQRFGVETTRDVQIGTVLVPKGTKGHGIVDAAQSGLGQKPGKLVLSMRSLDLADGSSIPVSFTLTDPPKSDDEKGPPISLGNGLVTIGGYATYGTNVVYEKGTAFTVTTLGANSFQPVAIPTPT